jgi:hypothetical protein
MKTVDRIFAWALLVLGFVHFAATFLAFKTLSLDAVWFICGGVAMALAAMINLLRMGRTADRWLTGTCCIANALMALVFDGVVPWVLRHDLRDNPQVIVVGLAVFVELVFSVRQWSR